MAATREFIDAVETSVEIDNKTLMNYCVQNYHFIYDKSCSDYRALQKNHNSWKKISESLNLPVDVAGIYHEPRTCVFFSSYIFNGTSSYSLLEEQVDNSITTCDLLPLFYSSSLCLKI